MMKLEIKWLCKFLEVPYCSERNFEVWQTTKCNYSKSEIGIVNYSQPSMIEQLTIFDFD